MPNVHSMLTEMIRSEDMTRPLRVYSLGERLRNTSSIARSAILRGAGVCTVGNSLSYPFFYQTVGFIQNVIV